MFYAQGKKAKATDILTASFPSFFADIDAMCKDVELVCLLDVALLTN